MVIRRLAAIAIPALLLLGCSGEQPSPLGTNTQVTAFDAAHVYYVSGDDRRVLETRATFPERGLYESITLNLLLSCPWGGCDWWDRIGSLVLVQNPGTENERLIEIYRFITPYRMEAAWSLDVTDLRPVLAGDATLRVYISTGVGPGSPNGAGWLVSAAFDFVGGRPAAEPVSVHPLWWPALPAWGNVPYGDPSIPIETSAPPRQITVPDGARATRVRTFVTGHGQGNAENCAEFCPRDHEVIVGGMPIESLIWRDDCPFTAIPDQPGTWRYPRAGWCPGADVYPWLADVPIGTGANGTLAIQYGVEPYENTCRPDAPEAPNCVGCTLGAGCDYTGGNHTAPRYMMSSALITYR